MQAFRNEPASLVIDGWEVNYLGFCQPENRHKTPLVLIGGAFQLFHSFISDIKAYLPHMPVILLALPGQASCREAKDSACLSMKDMADLMEGLFQSLDLEYVTLVGFSYGSLLAYSYAYHYEMRLEQLILVGCSLDLRHTQRQMLSYAINSVRQETLPQDAEAISQSLFNLNAKSETGLSMGLVEKLIHSIRRLSPEDLRNYQSISARLLRERMGRRSFTVKSLILTARHDHFIMPHESLEVHSLFENGDFVMLDKGDHLVPLQYPQLVFRTILQFLAGESLEGAGTLIGKEAIAQTQERRKQPRFRVQGMAAVVRSGENFQFEGILEDVSLDGCGLTLPSAKAISADFEGTWFLEIGTSGYQIPGFLRVFEGKASFVFFHKTLDDRDQLLDFISNFQDFPLRSEVVL